MRQWRRREIDSDPCDEQEAVELATSIAGVQEGKTLSRAEKHRKPQVRGPASPIMGLPSSVNSRSRFRQY